MQARSARTRTIAVASAVAVVVAGLGVVSASGNDDVPVVAAASSVTTTSTDTAARSSASLQRSLAAQSRIFSATAPAAEKRTAASSRSTTRKPAKPKPTFVGPIVWQGMPALEPGATHPAVKRLQKRLGIKVTGFYGPMTLAKVKAFQEWRGLPAKGYVGALTWQALYTPAPKKARTTSSASRSRSSAPAPSAPVTSGRVCPAPGSSFGSGWGAPRSGHLHAGVDLMGPRGMPILAIESGTIIRAGRQGNGAIRIVQQGISGSKFYYGHMDSITVGAGSRVKRGQVIGYMGDTGSPGAVHLHFEYWKSGGESAAVDPYPLLKSLCW